MRNQRAVEEKPRKKLSFKSGGSIKTGFSIQNELNPKKKEEVQQSADIGNLPHTSFTKEELQAVWTEYANKMQSLKKMSMYTVLNAHEPELDGDVVTIALGHEAAQNEYQNERSGLLAFLKSKLNNFYIDLQYRIVLKEEQPKKAYTNKDKLKLLQEENPALLDLVKKLDLDADF